jgi:hypothetical protein
MPAPSERHYTDVALGIRDGDVVPFLGAGANMIGRSYEVPWTPRESLPTGKELAEHLAAEQIYEADDSADLLHIAQFVATMRGYRRLYKTLHDLFDADFSPTPLHQFLASVPTLLSGAPFAERDPSFSRYQLITTTNYDDTLERAFQAVGEPYDLVSYKAEGPHRCHFLHWHDDDEPHVIEDANTYYNEISLESRTVILKIHGLVVRQPQHDEWESFVITEDHYIEYLMRSELSDLLPVRLLERLRNGNLLFLGYALRDWNLRVILQSIWHERDLGVPSWAVQLEPDEWDVKFWSRRDIDIYDTALDEYVTALEARLREVTAGQAA